MTVIAQNAFGIVVTVALAAWPRETVVVTTRVMSSALVTLSILIGDGAAGVDVVLAVAVGVVAVVGVMGIEGGAPAGREPVLRHAPPTEASATITADVCSDLIR